MLPPDPIPVLSSSQAKRMDQIAIGQLGVSGLVLMENAGIRCAQLIAGRYSQSQFVILCGTGNNGGDGLVIARQIAVGGDPVIVWISGAVDGMSPECGENWRILEKLKLPNLVLTGPECLPADLAYSPSAAPPVIIDAMLGISARGEPREPMARAIEWANRQPAIRIAIDVPTGLDPDLGEPAVNTFRADLTLTIECPKKFAANPSASEWMGELVVIPLGIPAWVARSAADGRQ